MSGEPDYVENEHVQLQQPYGSISYASNIAINLKSNPIPKHAL